jgi:hypothetical protein
VARILLDTNVLRNLAWNDRSQISEALVEKLIRAGQRNLLWCSTLTVSELASRLSPDEPDFARFRDCFGWMERLSVKLADLYEDILVGALTRSHRRSAREEIERLDTWRRIIARCESPTEIKAKGFDADACAAYLHGVQAGYARWGARVTEHGQALRRGDFDTAPGDDTPAERARTISAAIPLGVTPGVLEMCRGIAFDGPARPGGLLPDEQAARNLRELVHWHIGTVGVATFRSYNCARAASWSPQVTTGSLRECGTRGAQSLFG